MLREYLDAVLVNPWLRAVSRDTGGAHEITLATDSSDDRYAYCYGTRIGSFYGLKVSSGTNKRPVQKMRNLDLDMRPFF
jgi:hypothetical protein